MTTRISALHSVRSTWLAWIVLIVSLGGVALWAAHAHQLAQDRRRVQLDREGAELALKLEERMRSYEQVLRGAAALFQANPGLTREQWARYARSTRLRERFPGILGLGFTPYLAGGDALARFESAMRRDALPGFSVHPAGARAHYAPVAFLEPLEGRNGRALGYDMLTEARRLEALQRARDTGEPVLTARVHLIQDVHQPAKPGLLHVLPVYRPGSDPATVQARRAALMGWVYIPYFADELLAAIHGGAGSHLRIHDSAGASADARLYDSASRAALDEPDAREWHMARTVTVGERSWTLMLRPTLDERAWLLASPLLIAILGSLASVLLFWIVLLASRTRMRAQALAREMTAALEEKKRALESVNGLLDAVLNAIPATVAVKDPQGRYLLVNAAARVLHKVDPATMVGKTDLELYLPEQAQRYVEEDRTVLETGRALTLESAMDSMSGEARWVVRHKRAADLPDGRRGVMVVVDDITERKQAQAEVENQRELLHAVLDDSPSPQWVKDEAGRYILMNEAAAVLLGSSASQFIGRTADELYPAEEARRIALQDHAALQTDCVHSTEAEILSIDGRVGWGIKRERGIRLPDGRRILVVSVTDLTEQRRAQQQLESARALLDAVFDAAPVPIAVKDQDGRLLLSNPANEELVGMAEARQIGCTDRDLYAGDQLERILEEDAQARAADRVLTFDTEFVGTNGIWHSVVKHKRAFRLPGGGHGVVAIMHDVTPLRRAAQELERSQSMLDTVVESVPTPVFVKDVDHRWIIQNQASCAFLGVGRERLIGWSDFDLFPRDQAERAWAQDDQVLASGEPLQSEEVFVTAVGQPRWVLKSKRRAILADGTACVVGSITDITAIKQAEAQAKSAQQMAEAILDASPSPLWVKDERGRIILVNDAGSRLVGRARESLLGRTAEELFPPELAARIAEQDGQAWDVAGEHTTEGPLHSVDGHERWGIKSKRAMGLPDGRRVLIVSVNDLTTQRAARHEVERSRQFLEKILDSAPLPMFVKDDAHRFVIVNDAFSRLVQREAAALVGKTDVDIAPAQWAHACFAQDDAALASDYPLSWEDHLSVFDGSDR
ncbi:MAG: PAS domain-containing protein [Burkholderiales bacterium]|nr:PAS domain-containing protein [Burkholderiales bacterium]